LFAQRDSLPKGELSFFEPTTSFSGKRFWGLTGVGLSAYTAATIGLDQAWYAGYPRSSFHFFNDWNGWRKMDKMGHSVTGYIESYWAGELYRWSGLTNRQSAWVGFGAGMVFQSTLEVLDAFSSEWGFSMGDMAFNTIGSGTYLLQALYWQEQRIRFKLSTHRPAYSTEPIYAVNNPTAVSSLKERGQKLYGTSLAELFFKEYNGESIWISVNPSLFMKEKPKWLPAWLSIAGGYGIENVFGAERNNWKDASGNHFYAPTDIQRYSQFYLSFDIDFERIPTNKKWLKTLFKALSVFKFPAPALEYNTLGQLRGHWLYF
jgi:hypothetical protein